jgi:CBS domain-containing protein
MQQSLWESPMKNVAHILRLKSDPTVHSIGPTASVFEAIKLMAEKNIGALLIMEGETIVGMVSERDYARKVVLMGRSSKETTVRDIMTCPVMYVDPQQSTEECMALMTAKRLRHLPVLDDGKLIGLISIGDLVKDLISEQNFTIEQLQRYISGEQG